MTWRPGMKTSTTLLLCALSLAAGSPPQFERGRISFPRYLPKEAESPYERPLWVDARDVFDPQGELRRTDLAESIGTASRMRYRVTDGLPRDAGEGECYRWNVAAVSAFSHLPPYPLHMVDLEVLAAAIVHGKIVGSTKGFLRGRPVTLFELDVIDVLKGADVIGEVRVLHVFWPEVRFEFPTYCYQWGIGWPGPIPEVGAEVLLTPGATRIETIASRPVVVPSIGGLDAIWESAEGLRGPLSPTGFEEVLAAQSIRDLEIVRRRRR